MRTVNAIKFNMILNLVVIASALFFGTVVKAETCNKEPEIISMMKEISSKLDTDSCIIENGSASIVFHRSYVTDLRDHAYEIVTKLRSCCGGAIHSKTISVIDSDKENLTINAKCKH